MKKINVVQLLPYFPPHKWWLESHAAEWGYYWVKKWYGEVTNIVFWVGQEHIKKDRIIYWPNSIEIWYEKDGYKVIVLPAFDLISNYPIPKTTPRYIKEVEAYLDTIEFDLIQTRTRFFFSSLIGGKLAKKRWKKWIHIEHGSDFVVLKNTFFQGLSLIYDKIIWKWIFKNADKVIWISEACKTFITNNFVERDIDVVYRWLPTDDISKTAEKTELDWVKKIKVVYVGRLMKLKWVHVFLESLNNLDKVVQDKVQVFIIWYWNDQRELDEYSRKNWLSSFVKFLGEKPREKILSSYLKQTDIFINPSFQEWLPANVIEAMLSKCVVVATDVWGTKEISDKADLILCKPNDANDLKEKLLFAIWEYSKLKWLSQKDVERKFSWEKNIEKYFNLYSN